MHNKLYAATRYDNMNVEQFREECMVRQSYHEVNKKLPKNERVSE